MNRPVRFLGEWLFAVGVTLPGPVSAQQAPPQTPEKLFDPIGSVLQNPRCLNCHMNDRPFQRDGQVPHAQLIVRGADNMGAPTMRCAACHQDRNSADGRVPGAKGWHLAPRSMAWQGLSQAQICRNMKDPARNGNRQGIQQVIEHMKVDPLVLWAWNPGAGRSTPSISHDEFVKELDAWAEAGGPCPGDAPVVSVK